MAMCEGIARAGNGLCLMAVGTESILGKVSKLVRASSTYVLKNATVDWGEDSGSEDEDDPDGLTPTLQGPAILDSIYPGNRFIVFGLIEDDRYQAPKVITLHARRDGGSSLFKKKFKFQWVGDMSSGQSQSFGLGLLHILAARRIIMDLEDRNRDRVDPSVQALITRLGVEYQLVSRFTSFVAVDNRNQPVGLSVYSTTSSNATAAIASSLAQDTVNFSTVPEATSFAARTSVSARTLSALRAPSSLLMMSSSLTDSSSPEPGTHRSITNETTDLIRLQSFDGAFPRTPPLDDIIGANLLSMAGQVGATEVIWATALSVAYLKKYLENAPELLDGLVEKALAFMSAGGSSVNVDDVLNQAEKLIN